VPAPTYTVTLVKADGTREPYDGPLSFTQPDIRPGQVGWNIYVGAAPTADSPHLEIRRAEPGA
jgi:hypothetical protein